MGGGGPVGSSTTTTTLSPEQKQILGQGTPLVSQFVNAYNSGGVQSPTPANFNATQVAGQNQVLGASANGGSINQLGDTAGAANKFLNTAAIDPASNPALRPYIDAATQEGDQAFTSKVIPALRTDAINSGALGGSRDEIAQNLATNSFLRERGNTTSQILSQAYGQGLSAEAAGVSATPGTQQALTFPGAATEAVGAQYQDLANQTAASQFQNATNPLTFATQLFSSLAGLPGAGSSTVTTPAKPTSLIGKLFG